MITAAISTGTGTQPPRLVLPNVVTEPGMFEISWPLSSRLASPVAMPRVPRVTTSGGIGVRDTSRPLTAPKAPPASTAAAKPTDTDSRSGPLVTANQCAITHAPTMPEKPRTAPTDRSMPPVQMTNVSPTASSSTSVAVLVVFSQLACVRKYGEAMLKPMIRTSRTPPIHRSRSWDRFMRPPRSWRR